MWTRRPRRHPSWRTLVVAGTGLAVLGFSLPGQAEKSAAGSVPAQPAASPAAALKLGIYDPDGAFGDAPRVEIEHIFMPWEDVDIGSIEAADRYAHDRGRALLVTVEPWSWSPERPTEPTELRDAILSGRNDGGIRDLCSAFATLQSPVTVRWGHEMDLKNGRYPWSDWRPSDYVAAYRHFVDLCREQVPDLAFMWSPRGEFDLRLFYPGDDYVDSIGLSVFGYQAYDMVANGRERDLTALLKPSYDRAAKFNKPIYISEFGCSGDAAYVEHCNDFSAATMKQFPLLDGVVYYSAVEPGEWPEVYGKPDWRIQPGSDVLSSLD